jgi:hypothetical protein
MERLAGLSHQSLQTRPLTDLVTDADVIGEFRNGRGEFYGQDWLNGRAILVRFVISDVTPTSARFEQSFSDDGGRTWEVNWIAIDTRSADISPAAKTQTTGFGEAIDRDVERIRAATAAFKALDSAVAAGYSRNGGGCVANPPQGAMGYHHVNESLLDDRIEVERPELLVYERLPDGEYRLNGVEYIVPFSVRPPTAEPPTVMGQPLKPEPRLDLWYHHVWVWRENPSGLFADWNPLVKC